VRPMASRQPNISKAIRLAAIAAASAIFSAAATANADQISVEIDQARVLRLAAPAAAVVVGNPLFADATVQDRQTLIINGKSFGLTNLIAMDAEGRVIFEADLVVTEANAPQTTMMHLYRGAARSSFA